MTTTLTAVDNNADVKPASGRRSLTAVLVFALACAAAPAVRGQGIAADTESSERAHAKLAPEVSSALVAVAREAHPLTPEAMHTIQESGVVVDEGGRMRVAVTLTAPLDPDGQEVVDELGVSIEKTSRDGLTLRAWVPAENVEGLASLTNVLRVGPGSSWR